MSDEARLLYLEPDDEITSVVRRLRETDATRVVLVVPGRSRATASAVGLRLLATFAADAGRELALVADLSTRAMAAEAGIPAFATVADATSGDAVEDVAPPPRAPIHIVRGVAPPPAELAPAPRSGPADETMAVRLPPASRSQGARAARRGTSRAGWIAMAVVLVLGLVVGAVLLPAATIRIEAVRVAIGPLEYPLGLAVAGHEAGQLEATRSGMPTGEMLEQVPATGIVTFVNWSLVTVAVPKGTPVSVGGNNAFATNEAIVVPRGRFNGQRLLPAEGSAAVTAVEPGLAGNVQAGAIDTIDDAVVRAFLRGSPDNPNRVVRNDQATSGGAEVPHTVVQQADVDALVVEIEADLAGQLAVRLGATDRIFAAGTADEVPEVPVPDDLVGAEDLEAFELSGTLTFDRPFAMRSAVEDAALAAFSADTAAIPSGLSLEAGSEAVEVGVAAAVGDGLRVQATVSATAVADIDEEAIRQRVAGMTRAQAQSELADLGATQIDLWPAWVDRVPQLPFRISVLPGAPSPSETPGG